MASIRLEGIRIFAYHGALPEEQLIGSEYLIDIIIEANIINAAINDDLFQTIDYTRVYNIVAEEMKINSSLIENVGYRIIESITKNFKQALHITVKISKINPPVHGSIDKVSVILESARE